MILQYLDHHTAAQTQLRQSVVQSLSGVECLDSNESARRDGRQRPPVRGLTYLFHEPPYRPLLRNPMTAGASPVRSVRSSTLDDFSRNCGAFSAMSIKSACSAPVEPASGRSGRQTQQVVIEAAPMPGDGLQTALKQSCQPPLA